MSSAPPAPAATLSGPVIRGARQAHRSGYPTANVATTGTQAHWSAMYAVQVDIPSADGTPSRRYDGVGFVGARNMWGLAPPWIEVHLFDFDGDLYGQTLTVHLHDILHPMLPIPCTPAEWRYQMAQDVAAARHVLAALPGRGRQ